MSARQYMKSMHFIFIFFVFGKRFWLLCIVTGEVCMWFSGGRERWKQKADARHRWGFLLSLLFSPKRRRLAVYLTWFGLVFIDCGGLCKDRCSLHSRPNVCVRACGTCCVRCKCVPPGTSGNRELCGKCYTDMTTHGNKTKCP